MPEYIVMGADRIHLLPHKGYFGRMRVYLGEMFPIPGHAAAALLNALAIYGFVQTLLFGSEVQPHGAVLAMAFWNIFSVHLILRLMDEIKDKDIDRELFPERPFPSGRVLEPDIRFSLYAAIILYLSANSITFPGFIFALGVMGYAALMYKRFFRPELLKGSLPMTLLTHTPIIPINLLQVVVCITAMEGGSLLKLQWLFVMLYLLMIWCGILGWELSRKVRAAEEETAYVTYSQLLGRPGAVVATLLVQTLSATIGVFFSLHFSLGWPYLFLIGLGYTISMA
ncbi:MAG: hypothetical protein ACU83O_12240, partial [Gammaproteobacteria bacterium]